MAQPDISKIIGVIMENPDLIAQIKDMMEKAELNNESEAEPVEKTDVTENADREKVAPISTTEEAHEKRGASRRNELLRAIRPYVSEERSRAIETMISIADVIFAIKEK